MFVISRATFFDHSDPLLLPLPNNVPNIVILMEIGCTIVALYEDAYKCVQLATKLRFVIAYK